MKRRKTFLGMVLEPLEGRTLLNGGYGGATLARAQQRAAEVASGMTQQLRRAAGQGKAHSVPQGHVSTGSRVVKPNAAVSQNVSGLSPTARVTRLRSLAPATRNSIDLTGPATNIYNVNTSSVSTAGNGSGVNPGSRAFNQMLAAIYPSQAASGGKVVTAQSTGTVVPINALTGTTAGVSAPQASGSGTVVSFGTAGSAGTLTPLNVAAASAPLVSTGVAGPSSSSSGVVAGVPTPGNSMTPIRPAMPFGIPDGATLTPADLAAIKKAVDGFSASYTSGADATKDKAASDALRASLDGISTGLWAKTHVATAASAAQYQKAVDDFAKAYTSGANPAQDQAAWKALDAGTSAFHVSLAGGNPANGGSLFAGGMGGPGMTPGGGPGLSMLTGGLLDGPPMNAAEVAALNKAATAFVGSYTSGADAAKDQAALNTLSTSLGDLASAHWQRVMPTVNDGSVVPMTASSAGTPVATGSAVARATPTGPVFTLPTNYGTARVASGQVTYLNVNQVKTS